MVAHVHHELYRLYVYTRKVSLKTFGGYPHKSNPALLNPMFMSSPDATNGTDTLAALSRACVADADTQDAVAASLEQRVFSMEARATDAVGTTVARAGTLLAVGSQSTAAVWSDADRIVEMLRKHLEDDVIAEADSNAEQLASWSALSASSSCAAVYDFAYSAVLLGDALLFSSTHSTSWALLCVAPVQTDVTQLHRVCTSDIDAAHSSVSGQGLTAFDPSDGPEARQQNVICIIPRDVDGNVAEWVTAIDIRLELVLLDASMKITVSYEISTDHDSWRVVYLVGGQPDNVCINVYICEALVWKGSVRAETPLSAVTRAQAIKAKRSAATQADCHDLVGIATAFPTDADVQYAVCYAMGFIAICGGAAVARNIIAAGGHCVAVTALGAFSTNMGVLSLACYELWYIVRHGGVYAKAAICAVDDTLMDKLRQASDVITAAGEYDWAAGVLAQLRAV